MGCRSPSAGTSIPAAQAGPAAGRRRQGEAGRLADARCAARGRTLLPTCSAGAGAAARTPDGTTTGQCGSSEACPACFNPLCPLSPAFQQTLELVPLLAECSVSVEEALERVVPHLPPHASQVGARAPLAAKAALPLCPAGPSPFASPCLCPNPAIPLRPCRRCRRCCSRAAAAAAAAASCRPWSSGCQAPPPTLAALRRAASLAEVPRAAPRAAAPAAPPTAAPPTAARAAPAAAAAAAAAAAPRRACC